MDHAAGDVTREPITTTEYPVFVVWATGTQALCYIPEGWAKSKERADLLAYVAQALHGPAASARLKGVTAEVHNLYADAFDIRPEDVREDVAGWALADSLLAVLVERAYARNHTGRP